VLHGSRSGLERSTQAEYESTARYAVNEPNGYGWNVTVGSDALSVHMTANQWAWHARGCSSLMLGAEFAQGTLADAIDDGQIRAFCYWVEHIVRPAWPTLPLYLPMHSEVDGSAMYGGVHDGKTDTFERFSARAESLRARILATLKG
jgi:hypothetical protein